MQIHPIGLQQDAGSDSEEATTVNKAMIIQKAGADEIHSDAPDVKFTPVAYTN